MTGRQNIRYTAKLNGISDAVSGPRIDELLERVNMTKAADDPTETYSRGMLQRLGIADALVKEPLVLILDEPTTSIDPVGVAETLELVTELAHSKGVSVLLSSHLLHQVQQVCDRMAIFVNGSVAALGTVQDLAGQQQTGAQVQIEVGADGDPTAVASTLRSVPGVTDVARDVMDRRLFVVTGEPGVRRLLAQALVAAGQTPWQLRTRGMDLDEIYQRYFAAAAATAATAAPARTESTNV